jgi:opacity protein-like surface antigen
MKKLAMLLTTVSALSCGKIDASSVTVTPVASKDLTGIYLGATTGYHSGTGQHKTLTTKRDAGLQGQIGGLFVGIQKDYGKIVVGAEASFDLSNTSGSINDDKTGKFRLRHKNSFGFAARLGTKIGENLYYVKAAYDNSKFSSHLHTSKTSASQSKRLDGFMPGVGIEKMINANLVLGAEWSYAIYNGKHFITQLENETVKDYNSPSLSHIKMRLAYKW